MKARPNDVLWGLLLWLVLLFVPGPAWGTLVVAIECVYSPDSDTGLPFAVGRLRHNIGIPARGTVSKWSGSEWVIVLRLRKGPEKIRTIFATPWAESEWDTTYRVTGWEGTSESPGDSIVTRECTTVPEPEPPSPPEPEPPSPPPEPEPPSPPPEPEPDTPEPEACPAEPACDHIAIVPSMPRAMSGNEDAPDHWLRITNPHGESITVSVTGRDERGTESGTYRRELPAYRSVKVKMRDIEAAFDATEPEGWWTLTVTASGTVHVVPMMRHGDTRIVLPVARPGSCPGSGEAGALGQGSYGSGSFAIRSLYCFDGRVTADITRSPDTWPVRGVFAKRSGGKWMQLRSSYFDFTWQVGPRLEPDLAGAESGTTYRLTAWDGTTEFVDTSVHPSGTILRKECTTPGAPEPEPPSPPPEPEPPSPPPEPEPPSPPPEPEPPSPPPEPEPPSPPEPEPPSPPPEPEPPSPPPEPEPETPEPEACPAEPACDHIAIVPSMPRTMSGNEDGPDHWLRITNPHGESITVSVTGRDERGTKSSTYRRELPAYRSVKVKMRDIEAAFDATEPEGWWTLTVTAGGTVHVVPMMRHGDTRIVLPVARPGSCPGPGGVTRSR